VNPEYIQQSKAIYENAEPEYRRYYFDEVAGGFVLIHQDHNLNNSESFVAEVLAKIGKRVTLLSEKAVAGVRTPDAEIDGQICEFKELTESTRNIRYRVQEGISRAKNQGVAAVIFHINRENYDVWKINAGIKQGLFWDTQNQIQEIIFVANSKQIQIITREDWQNGRPFQRI
jgi:Contact-dependent growth inhibition CdiA C-terminal domain